MAHKLNFNIFYVALFSFLTATLVSCSEDELSIDLKNLCQLFPSKQVKLTLNGEVINPAGDIAFAFPDLKLPEEEVYKSKMLLEILPLWPNCSMASPSSNIYFDVDAISSPHRITFSGEARDASLYSLKVEGCYENDTLKLNLNYRSEATNLIGNTYEIQLNSDALDLSLLRTPSGTIDWNGELVPTEKFIRESLKTVFKGFVDNTGYDAVQFTFLEDGAIKLSFRDAQNKSFVSVPGHYAYRFHDYNFGCFEVGQEEAISFSKAMFPYDSSLPNGLFWFTTRAKGFIPVYYQTYGGGNLLMSLELKDYSIFKRFLSEWTMNISDHSDEVLRLRKINSMFYDETIKGRIMLNVKKK